MAYIGNIPVPQATQTRDRFTATSGQTTFATSGYTPGFLDVYLNGVHLDASDYTATNGSDVVLDTGAATDDIVEVVAFTAFNVSEKLPDQTGNAGEYLTTDGSALSWGTITDPTPAAVSGQANTATDFFALPSGTTAQRPGSPAAGYLRNNTETGLVEVYDGAAWIVVGLQSLPVAATGGTTNTYTASGVNYKSHTFTSSDDFVVTNGGLVDVLLVAGGGAGGNWHAGGGGAGGLITSEQIEVYAGTYSLVIGGGGAGGTTSVGNNGTDTTGFTLTAIGGGRGGNYITTTAASGGSGGGGNGTTASPYDQGASGTSGQGNAGGNGNGNHAGGGGGGAGAVGQNAADANNAGDGGIGVINTYKDGTDIYYAGGGGSGVWGGTGYGVGGSGGGGNGSYNNNSNAPTPGSANTGGGGGGAGSQGNVTSYAAQTTGGSGIVIVRYRV